MTLLENEAHVLPEIGEEKGCVNDTPASHERDVLDSPLRDSHAACLHLPLMVAPVTTPEQDFPRVHGRLGEKNVRLN